jgi:hypothetical protein
VLVSLCAGAECRSADLLKRWCTEVLACWSARVVECWNNGVLKR